MYLPQLPRGVPGYYPSLPANSVFKSSVYSGRRSKGRLAVDQTAASCWQVQKRSERFTVLLRLEAIDVIPGDPFAIFALLDLS